ncbi:MAG: hypothetical protein JWM74_2641 [Myxococcaceae bacterium]|nr:hypothetical protein [Myxococcaceae bacterium]
MSFDLHFQPCRFDGTTEKRFNPFTKQMQDVPRNEPLSPEEASAVLDVLKRAGAEGPDEEGCHLVRFDDGSSAEIFAKSVETGCMVAIRGAGVTPALAKLLFDVMVAGRWVLLGEEEVVLAPSHECLKGTPKAFGQVVVAHSPDDIGAVLSGGYEAWRKYRSRALRES